jgi:hypothetical protein
MSSKAGLAIVSVTLGLTAFNVRAQDPVAVCPNNFKVLAEDDTTRVLHFSQRKGETCGMHSHPYLVGYTLKSGGTLNYILPDGTKVPGNPAKAGNVLQRGPVTHSHEAPDQDVEAIVVELKRQ